MTWHVFFIFYFLDQNNKNELIINLKVYLSQLMSNAWFAMYKRASSKYRKIKNIEWKIKNIE